MSTATILVNILGKDYQVACSPGERDDLLRAASELDRRMRDIRHSGSVIGLERIAVMAGLNLAHEVLHAAKSVDSEELESLHQRIDKLLR